MRFHASGVKREGRQILEKLGGGSDSENCSGWCGLGDNDIGATRVVAEAGLDRIVLWFDIRCHSAALWRMDWGCIRWGLEDGWG